MKMLWFLCLVFLIVCKVNSLELSMNFSEVELDVRQNFNVTCSGNGSLKWKLPFEKPPDNFTKFKYEMGKNSVTLHIYNMTYKYVGLYSCESINDVKSIYFFVNDDEHLSVDDGKSVGTVFVTQFSDTIIPCRPTSRSVTVELYLDYVYVPFGILNDDFLYSFHPYFGIYTNDTVEKNNCRFLTCKFKKDLQSYERDYCLDIEEPIPFLPVPYVEDRQENHTETGQNITLMCEISVPNSVFFKWLIPRKSYKNVLETMEKGQSHLVIMNATLEDSGQYICIVTDRQNHIINQTIHVKVIEKGKHYIQLSTDKNYIMVKPEETVVINVEIDAHPAPTISWLNNHHQKITTTDKYAIFSSSTFTTLQIFNVDIGDIGNYTIRVVNIKDDISELSIFVNVTVKPTVNIKIDDFHLINKNSEVICEVGANPPPTITWFYQPCDSCKSEKINETRSSQDHFKYISVVTINAAQDGYLTCTANNTFGNDTTSTGYYVSDIDNGFDIINLQDRVYFLDSDSAVVTLGGDLSMSCGAAIFNYSDITWFFNNSEITNDNYVYSMEMSSTKYSNKVKLEKFNVSFQDQGVYSCRILRHGNEYVFKNISVRVMEPTPIQVLLEQSEDQVLNIALNEEIEVSCDVFGIPKPEIMWLKNSEHIWSFTEEVVMERNPYVRISTNVSEDGVYQCFARLDSVEVSKSVTVTVKRPESYIEIIVIGFFVVFLLFVLTVIWGAINHFSKKKLEKEMKLAGLENFIQGAVENINPNLAIDEQADLLPYDPKWEFPIEDLKLGKQLGSGAFGVVLKAVARNIVDDEDNTIVAVKMVKKNAEPTLIKALASELKIMVHLGKHLNVLNLLGACTKNVAKRELLVIVEFCRYGNLHNYLLKHRSGFVNQVDPKTGSLDYSIGQDILERADSMSSSVTTPTIKYAELSFANNHPEDNSQGSRSYSINYSARTEVTSLSSNPDEVLLSNNSVQPEWRSNYKGDYKGKVKPICTKDLLIWAFQVSRGMEYLASRKVLHGDLAARNILLSDNNVVKICDFGLAKSMYKSDNYQKQGDAPLPIKWMAIESISDRVFSTQSDVWSFGVVLWEFFSLSKTPYPGMQPDQTLYEKLVDGYRMEKPEFAPKEMYKMMMDCWNAKPICRPSFTSLTERLGDFIEDSVRKHYIDLNDPYLLMNTQKIENGANDYLAMLSPPDYEVLSSPDYLNHMQEPELDQEGYLKMNSSDIFSPRITNGEVFDFPVPNRATKETPKEEEEVIPMIVPNSFSNPSYHLPPKMKIQKTSDNYVNMPQNKQELRQKDKIEAENPNYVNSCTRDWESIKT